MAKKTNSKIFAKNEVLGSNALNQKFEDVGSVGGVQPYDTNHSQDTTMSMPIGSKATPFGNLFCKGRAFPFCSAKASESNPNPR